METRSAESDEARYEAIRRRDARAEGRFYYSVVTTGIYCRPTCGARLPLRANVRFFGTPDQAEKAGFRACKRCRPRERSGAERRLELVAAARALLESADTPVRLADLAASAGLSPFHFQRLFKKQVGMSPREYAAACRLRRFGEVAQDRSTVTAAIYEAGYSSSSRFYEAAGQALGMAPSELRRGADGLQIRAVVRACSLGQVLVAATARGVCAISIAGAPAPLERDLRRRFPRAIVLAGDRRLERLAAAVVELIDRAGLAADLPLDLVGTVFQQRVWRALRGIPRGTTISYAELARRIGAPRAVRAVASACGANPVAVVVPCHRVIRGDGGPGGYRWGLARKKALLARERSR